MNSLDFYGVEQRATQIVNLALIEYVFRNYPLEISRSDTIKHYDLYKHKFSDEENFWMEKIVIRALEMFDELIGHPMFETTEIDLYDRTSIQPNHSLHSP